MQDYRRYAVYYTPEGALADFGAAWLGWDVAAGREVAHPDVPGVDVATVTDQPRRYGFHATMKAPMRLADGVTPDDALHTLEAFCAEQPAFDLPVRLGRLGTFLAIVPAETSPQLSGLEARLVPGLDHLRAQLGNEEAARRKPETMTARQRALFAAYGYPHVLDQFHFHMTLTGEGFATDDVARALDALLAPLLVRPLPIDSLSLLGEDEGGRFHLIRRVPLTG